MEKKIEGTIMMLLLIVIILVVAGAFVAPINTGLDQIAASGWGLASLFNKSSGVVTYGIMAGLLIGVVAGGFALGQYIRAKK